MNSRTIAAPLRRLGLALLIGGIAVGGAVAAADQAAPPAATDEATQARSAPGHGWHQGGHMGRRRAPGRHEGEMNRGFLAALRQLNLTPVQREQMRTIMFNASEAARMERANAEQSGEAQRRRDDFTALSNPGDPNYEQAVQQLKSRAAERVQQAIQRTSETDQKLYNVLTAEQKAQLPKVLSDMKARREQHMQTMRMRPEGRAPDGTPPEPSPPAQ